MKKIITVFFMALVISASAMAAPTKDVPGHNVTIGGLVGADMGWQVLAEDSVFVNESNNTITNFFATIDSDSYLRATFSSADKNIGSVIELGMCSSMNYDNAGGSLDSLVTLNAAYGWWKVGNCKLLVGQMSARLADGGTHQMLGNMKSGKGEGNGFGFIGAARNSRVALQVTPNEHVAFELALGQAGSKVIYSSPVGYVGDDLASTNSYLPRLEAVLDFTFANLSFGLGGGIAYQTIKVNEDIIPADAVHDDSVLSYLLWLPVTYNHGPFSALLNIHYGQNIDTEWTSEMASDFDIAMAGGMLYGGQPSALPYPKDVGNGFEVENTISWGIGLDLHLELSDALGLALGGGFSNLSNDAWGLGWQNDGYTRWMAYMSAPYAISDNFIIQPEVSYYNYGKLVEVFNITDKERAGDEWLLGVHLMLIF